MIRFDVNQVGMFVIPNYRIFAPNFFNFKIIFAFSIFKNIVVSKVFNFNFCCAMPQRDTVSKIQLRAEEVEDSTAARIVSLWYYGSDGSLWVHSSAVINIMNGSSASNIDTTIQNIEVVVRR